jgi:hypothetical protein
MHKITRVGVDLAKNVIQVHVGYASCIKVANKALKRDQFINWCTQQLPAGCMIVIKGTSGAHHWVSSITAIGLRDHAAYTNQIRTKRLCPQSGILINENRKKQSCIKLLLDLSGSPCSTVRQVARRGG